MRGWFCLLLFCAASSCCATERVLQQWDFATATGRAGWMPADVIAGGRVVDAALALTPGTSVVRLESPVFDSPTAAWQRIEIEMSSDTGGTGYVYFSNTTDQPYNGFRPGQYVTFDVPGDGIFHTHIIYPFWERHGKIVHIRVDPPGEHVRLRSVRVVDPDRQPHTTLVWDLRKGAPGWIKGSAETIFQTTASGCKLSGNYKSIVLAPPLDLDTRNVRWATIRMSSTSKHTVLLRYVLSQADGLQSVPIRVRGDGVMRSYSVELSSLTGWAGRLKAIGLSPADRNDPRSVLVESVAISSGNPVGPASLVILSLTSDKAFVRAGQQFNVTATVRNDGGQPAGSISVSLPGASTQQTRRISQLLPGQAQTLTWHVTARRDDKLKLPCSLKWPGGSDKETLTQRIYPALSKAAMNGLTYVPQPRPADTGEYLVGAYYYPGWDLYSKWSVLNDFPERRPLLGYYREGDPEVADWQINWALSHGIGYFIYDWYWEKGWRHLEHALDALFKSRYGSQMKFCLLWANHNPPNTHSEQDLLDVTRYWIENYFRKPNYLKIDGRNVLVMYAPQNLRADMGSEAIKPAFDKMRRMCEDAGVGGLYIVACTGPDEAVKPLASEGYDAASGYNYNTAGSSGHQYSTYESMVKAYPKIWQQIASNTSLPYIPVCEPGWDSRPWHGRVANIRTDKSPELWQRMLGSAKAFVDDPKHTKPEGRKLVFLEAWNEFGEGDYIEPHAQYGFDNIEAVRKVFAPQSKPPVPIVPEDLAMGPYALEPTKEESK